MSRRVTDGASSASPAAAARTAASRSPRGECFSRKPLAPARGRRVATFGNGLGVSDDEEGAQIYVATGLRTSWARAWPAFRDYA